MSSKNLLSLTFEHPDLEGQFTIGEFLKELLCRLWHEEEGFDGKRPFGNSGWQQPVYAAMIKAGYVQGTLDEDGYIVSFDEKKAEELILEAIVEYL